MLTSGDVVELELGTPVGSEAGLLRSAVVVTAARILQGQSNVVQVVPLTSTIRKSSTEVLVVPDKVNGLTATSAAQCQHLRSIATARIRARIGNVGPLVLCEVREVLGLLMDL